MSEQGVVSVPEEVSVETRESFAQLSYAQLIEKLVSVGLLRDIDEQFALMLMRLNDLNINEEQHPACLLAALISQQLGLGHVCLKLEDLTNQPAKLISLYGVEAEIFNQKLANVDWLNVAKNTKFIGNSGDNTPIIFEGDMFYLHRFHHYECELAAHIKRFSPTLGFLPTVTQKLTQDLNELFKPELKYLFSALQQLKNHCDDSQIKRQQLVCESLDVVDETLINWAVVNQLIDSATTEREFEKLHQLIPNEACLNWQKVAAALALSRQFSVISGGPGTGKTTTVAKLLAAIIQQAISQDADAKVPTIKLVAPTGKAAARLTESIGNAIEALPISPDVKALMPASSATIHRLLGVIPQRAEFRHNNQNPLHLDILIIDEASMVDLSMMYKVFQALPAHAKVILLGDKDQLASVEAGAVLGEICAFYNVQYSHEQVKWLEKLTGYQSEYLQKIRPHRALESKVSDCLCVLQKSYRFDARSGIGQLARAVNEGDRNKLDMIWQAAFSDIRFYELSSQNYQKIIQNAAKGYQRYLELLSLSLSKCESEEEIKQAQTERARTVLQQFAKVRVLCAVREGDFGVEGLNNRIENRLNKSALIQKNEEAWYEGRPVMITRNDHGQSLFNGDLGITIFDPVSKKLKVYFELADGSVKGFLPSRIPEHETAYAMTIHKSQGSEFNTVHLVLPAEYMPLLTRELIYTGITRAKSQLALYADLAVFERGVSSITHRNSGLAQRLG
jgi:exodeoxyribonuclease V alpha subunit